jgi:Arc/MetJ-type ribon-helix-helix transcriptional regulator
MRLNVRLPEELARKLEALERATGQSTSDIVRTALERYFAEICRAGRSSREAIHLSGLVGCGETKGDLSTTYKSRLREDLRGKHAIADKRDR